MQEFRIGVGLELNSNASAKLKQQITSRLNNISKTNKVRINLDTTNAEQQIRRLRSQIQGLGNITVNVGGSGGSGGNGVRSYGNSIYRDMLNLQQRLRGLRLQLGGLENADFASNQIRELRVQINSLTTTYNNMMSRLNSGHLSAEQFTSLNNYMAETENRLNLVSARIDDVRSRTANGIITNISNGTFDTQVNNLESRLETMSVKSSEAQNSVQRLKISLRDMLSASNRGDTEGLISAYERFNQVLRQTRNQLSVNNNANNISRYKESLDAERRNLSLKMDVWLKNNSASASEFGARLKELKMQLMTCSKADLSRIRREFTTLTLEAEKAGKATMTFSDRLKHQFARVTTYFSATMIIMQSIRALRQMYTAVYDIDVQMTELKKVTNETGEAYNQFLTNASGRAVELGTTIKDLVASTAEFARLGYSFGQSQNLAEVANIYAVVGDEIEDINSASKSIISTMTAFDVKADESISIVDKFNEVGNNFAISSGGIGEALKRSASSLASANNTLDESIAIITASNTVVQDPVAIGTALKTLTMRIRGAKTELEEAGLDTEGMASSTAKLREEIMALSGVDIMLDENTFKSTYQILDELAYKWKDLTDIQQASITELVAGIFNFYQYVQKCA